MARQILPIVGAVVGSFFGAPQIGFAIGSLIGNIVDPQVVQGPKIGDAGIQTSAEGVPCPIVFGTAPVVGNVIARGNRQIKKQRESQGKGGPVLESERVFWTFAIRLAEPIAGVTRIWMEEKLVYDVRPGSTLTAESSEFADKFRLYLGDEDQLPDPDLEVIYGMGNTPAYRGRAYVVFPNFDLTDWRERIPTFRFEVISNIASDLPIPLFASGTGSDRIVSAVSAGAPFSTEINSGLVTPDEATNIFSAGGRLYHFSRNGNGRMSDDNGDTWRDMVGLPTTVGYRFIMAVLYLGGRTFLFPEDDNLTDWYYTDDGVNVLPNPVYPVNALSQPKWCAVSHEGLGLVGQGTGYIGITEDYGDTWRQYQAIPGRGHAVHFLVHTPTAFMAASRVNDTTLMRSLEGDEDSWVEVDWPGRSTSVQIWSLAAEGSRVILTTNLGEVWYSDNNGVSWTQGGDLPGPVEGAHNAMTHSGGYFLGGIPSQFQIAGSNDGGETWGLVYNEPTTGIRPRSIVENSVIASGLAGAPVPLSYIVSSLHERAGHTASDYDVSELDDLVTGIVLAGEYTCADAIRSLMPPYFFDSSEHDRGVGYRVNYIKRGAPVVTTVTGDSLLDAPEKTTRQDPLEWPRALHFHYQSPIIGYAPAKSTVMRSSPDIKVVGERAVQVPVCFSDVDEPMRIAHKLLKIAYVEVSGEEEFALGDNWLDLVPTDCIGLSLRGEVRRLRITQEMIDSGAQSYRMIPDRQSAVTSSLTGIPLPPPTPPPPSIVGQTIDELMDLPALNDNNDTLNYYRAMSGQTEAWAGAQGQIRTINATDFTDDIRFTQNTIMGVLVDPISAASEHYPDTTNVVRVQLYTDDEIESLTDAQFLSEGGSFALKNDDGTWEILQYRDVDDEGSRTFALSHLARGRLNTGGSAHSVGARFVLLEGVRRVDTVTANLDTTLDHRAVSIGTAPDTAIIQSTLWTGLSQTEFPVANLLLDISGSTLEARAVPRHRFGTEDNPVQSSNWVGYRWTVTDGVNTINRDGLSATELFDVTGWTTPITVTVAQRNRFTGPGPTVSESTQ